MATGITWTSPPADEQGVLDWMRRHRENQPVTAAPNGSWHVFGYPEAVECMSNHVDFSNATTVVPDTSALKVFGRGNLSWMDPPEHGRLRSVINSAFSARATIALEAAADRIT